MSRKTLLIVATPFFLAVLIAAGCADAIDDPDTSDNILVIDEITPSEVESDHTPPGQASDLVTVKVRGILRNTADPDLSDVTLTRYTISYSPPLGTAPPISSLAYPFTATVPAGGSLTFDAIAVNVVQKAAGIADGVHTATITLEGEDVLENPAAASGQFQITVGDFVPLDSDSDGFPDTSDNCPFTPNPGQIDTDLDGTGDVCDPDPLDPNIP